jgi:hypothetical protein
LLSSFPVFCCSTSFLPSFLPSSFSSPLVDSSFLFSSYLLLVLILICFYFLMGGVDGYCCT